VLVLLDRLLSIILSSFEVLCAIMRRFNAREDTMIDKLYDVIGGRRTISAVTKRFYKKVLKDDSLRQFFRGTDMDQLRAHQVMFVSMLLGGTVYAGKDIHSAPMRWLEATV
jgi:truncated hemoglobin YjbI